MSDQLAVPEHWVSKTLINLADFHNGRAFKERDWSTEGLPIIRIEQLNNPSSDTDKFSGILLPVNHIDTGNLIFSWSATLKVIIWNGGPAALNQHLYKVVPKSEITLPLLRYILDFNMDKLAGQSQGSTMKHVTRKELTRFKVSYPQNPLEQHKISSVLSSIDQAIESTQALIEKYQLIKAGLMHDLFTRGIGADGKLRPPREAAPALYQETAIGWIPKEWNYKELVHGLRLNPKNGYSPTEVEEWQGLYVLGLGCLTKEGFMPVHLKNAPRAAASSCELLKSGDFLISRSNTPELVGLCGIYKDVGENAIHPDLMVKLKLNGNLDAAFLEAYLLSPAARQKVSAIAVGTSGSMVKINSSNLRSLKIIFPSINEQQIIAQKLKPINDKIDVHIEQGKKLRKQKAGLMHDLLTGKVQVTVDNKEVNHA